MKRNQTNIIKLYSGAGFLIKFLVWARPYICPMEPIISNIPMGKYVLDVGCGSGALLITASMMGIVKSGVGVDINQRSITIANNAAMRIDKNELHFLAVNGVETIPAGPFDVVTMIDVMHHIPRVDQDSFFEACISRVLPNGLVVYKDMASKPLWKAIFNRLHDMILARQFIHYFQLDRVISIAERSGFEIVKTECYSYFAYAHEMIVFRKK